MKSDTIVAYLVPTLRFLDNDQQPHCSMKPTQRIAAFVAVLVMVAAARHAHAQVAGGWSNVSVRDSNVVSAARFAVTEYSRQERVTLKKIVRARRQVVAGMNYEVTLLVRRGKKVRRVVAVVWRKVDGGYELTSWSWRKGNAKV
jgi:hypothetical protein